jgi:hypothetical protein
MKLPALKEIIEERKGKAVENLSASFAKNKLPLEEYERLVEYINKIESERELVIVEKIVCEYGGDDEQAAEVSDREDEWNDHPKDYYSYHNHSNSLSNLAVLSSRSFSGPIQSGAQFFSILGSEHIKIRKADLNKRQTVINAVTILGDCVIFVEPGIRVSNRAIPILGGAWTDNKVNKQAQKGDPELIISGAALLGNINVKVLNE